MDGTFSALVARSRKALDVRLRDHAARQKRVLDAHLREKASGTATQQFDPEKRD